MEKDKNYVGFFLVHMVIPMISFTILKIWTKNVSGGDLAVIVFSFMFGLLHLIICVIAYWKNTRVQNYSIWGCLIGNALAILLSILVSMG